MSSRLCADCDDGSGERPTLKRLLRSTVCGGGDDHCRHAHWLPDVRARVLALYAEWQGDVRHLRRLESDVVEGRDAAFQHQLREHAQPRLRERQLLLDQLLVACDHYCAVYYTTGVLTGGGPPPPSVVPRIGRRRLLAAAVAAADAEPPSSEATTTAVDPAYARWGLQWRTELVRLEGLQRLYAAVLQGFLRPIIAVD